MAFSASPEKNKIVTIFDIFKRDPQKKLYLSKPRWLCKVLATPSISLNYLKAKSFAFQVKA